MNLLASWTMDMWSPIINLFSFIPSYGWMIVVFTICLKLILSPLDFWQRKVSRDSAIKQQRLQPQLEKLQRQCGNNRELLNKKTMALYKKEGYNVVGSCFSMLINLVLTLFIFITLFYGLTEIAQDKTYKQYQSLETEYKTTFVTELNDPAITSYEDVMTQINNKIELITNDARDALIADGITEPTEQQIKQKAYSMVLNNDYAEVLAKAQTAVEVKYEKIKDSWLWVDSIWRPETYKSGVANYNEFYGMTNLANRFRDDQSRIDEINLEYNYITANIQQKYSSWNGYFILAIIAAVVTYFSFTLTQNSTQEKKKQNIAPVNGNYVDGQKKNQQQQQPKAMGIMKFIMPVIMLIFVVCYSTAFALYIVTNSIMSVIISLISMQIFKVMDKKKKDKTPPKVEYSRN